ncbi:hypothetical protein KFL_004530195 [Klebsormidium nitens]|uniref:Metallo-beta-lactamase domain-containing protein n=1 Tax=Klebsormidium nitens TaxID=105231 RepID=A0A1Y1ICN3_KLENI|nr:hypothetical protein KFL_004530195 [Klebsormidium nitens]|eukprot:GAQ88715.1 hypothetical protein KFL_004530195 [Klebsormidium nitens]
MAPSPSLLNLIATPGRSALTVNLRPRKIAPEVIWLPCAQEDPMAYNLLGLTANAYLLLLGRQAVAVDATSPFIIPLLHSILREEKCTLSALLLTHRHIALAGKPQGQGLRDFKRAFPRAPVFLHPSDAEHEEGKVSGFVYDNPIGSALLSALGVETWEFPGHTRGHVHYYLDRSGGVLCTGDSAVGAPMHRSEPGRDAMCRAPVPVNEDDGEAARQWSDFLHNSARPSIATICPYHGKVYRNEMPRRVEFLLDQLRSPWPTVVP